MKKRFLFTILAFMAIVISSFKFIHTALPIGSELPKADVKLMDISSKFITMKEASRENGLLVMFSCNTCPYVIANQERTREICQYALNHKIGVILLNSNEENRTSDDSFSAMQDYAKDQHYNWYYVVDKNNEVADAFGANRTPECYLFNKELKLEYHGAIDNNPNDPSNVTRQHLREAINELLAGKPVSVKESRSVGCSIKRV